MNVTTSILHGYRKARDEHPGVDLAFGDFAERALELARARVAREARSAATDTARVDRALERLPCSDLYLAVACDRGREGAFPRFLATYRPRLSAFLRRSGVRASDASDLLDELHGDLATPPPDGRTRTRLGTYEGASSLFSWLVAILVRRRADRERSAWGAIRLDEHVLPAGLLDSRPSRSADPLDELVDGEDGELFESVLRATYAELTPRERLCLHLRFEDDLSQREIARMLAVGEPRVSRLVEQVIRKLRRNLLRISAGESVAASPTLRESIGACLRSLRADSADSSLAERLGGLVTRAPTA